VPHVADDILDSLVLITESSGKRFGTGFAVRCEQGATWVVTCAHVIDKLKKMSDKTSDVLRVRGRSAQLVACASPEEADLAVIKVEGIEIPVLRLGFGQARGKPCLIAGYAKFAGERRRAEPLDATLGYPVVIEASDGTRVKAWKLWIKGQTPLEVGYSGSPVIDATGAVFAVASDNTYQGERGYAVSLAHLRSVWPDLPPGLLPEEPPARAWLDREEHEFLETLFAKSPVPDLRRWCHQAMPPDLPHEIPANANALDLLEWLMERGQQRVPLLEVLRKLAPKIAEAQARTRLEQIIQRTEAHFGVIKGPAAPKPTMAVPQEAALLLEIWPPMPSENRCHVQGWLFRSTDLVQKVYVREKAQALRLNDPEDLKDLVEDLHGIFVERGVSEDRVIIEFILPTPLLSQAVEQWTDRVGVPLGIDFPVVVRARERLRNSRLQLHWPGCWQTLCARHSQTFPDGLWWFEDSVWRQVPRKLQEGVCIALHFVPNVLAPPTQNALLYLLHRGAPVALWPRQSQGLADFERALNTFLQGKAHDNLPQVIRNVRRELWEAQQENAACYHLTLLWDDPTRRMPGQPEHDEELYQAPV
jgi:hypothetical protein